MDPEEARGDTGLGKEKGQLFHVNTNAARKEQPSEPIIKAMESGKVASAKKACGREMFYVDRERSLNE